MEVADVGDAIVDEFAARYDTREAEVDDATRRLANALEPEHRPPGFSQPGRRRGCDR